MFSTVFLLIEHRGFLSSTALRLFQDWAWANQALGLVSSREAAELVIYRETSQNGLAF
jgi:hypothetical protein